MLSHTVERGVLVITVLEDPGIGGRAALLTQISEPAATEAAVSVVLRVHRLCSHLDLVTFVATHSAPARRLLDANADTHGIRMVIHARAHTAIETATALTTAA
ncbi:hypothetical protein ACFV46_26595 [Streptomyces sp. NPDC059852]|uniref:hypothetical protein n=1 Tax=Streptomyces sp. NPDC059852 TaxID=3346972 RepID=UPI00365E7465